MVLGEEQEQGFCTREAVDGNLTHDAMLNGRMRVTSLNKEPGRDALSFLSIPIQSIQFSKS